VTGRLIILSGPSGVGKDTIIDAWRAADPRVQRVVAYTTRKPRPGEQDGIDYHFVSETAFRKLADMGAFLEFKEVHGEMYATPLSDMEAMLKAGKVAILKIDVQGALEAMSLRPDALAIFLLPPSEAELERRIKGRGTEEAHVIERRLARAKAELALADRYHHRVVNDDVQRAVHELVDLTT